MFGIRWNQIKVLAKGMRGTPESHSAAAWLGQAAHQVSFMEAGIMVT